MRVTEVILFTLDSFNSFNEEISGRTLLQKAIYFINTIYNFGLEFTPHYYGPHSNETSEEIQGLVAAGFIEEVNKKLPPLDFGGAHESRLYIYRLTESGKKLVEHLRSQISDVANKVELVVGKILEADGTETREKTLSISAKMHHILTLTKRPVDVEEILEEAEVIGWQISREEAIKAIEFLKKLGLKV